MAREERYGTRDLAFSAWHRALPRDDLTWIDIDHCAYCDRCKEPLYLIELAQDVGQAWKTTTVTRRVAEKLCVPALLVLYTAVDGQIQSFRVRRVVPSWTEWATVEPCVLSDWLKRQHDEHVCLPAATHEALREAA